MLPGGHGVGRGAGFPGTNVATVQQCGKQGLWGGEHVNFLGHGVAHHEAGRPALPFLDILNGGFPSVRFCDSLGPY